MCFSAAASFGAAAVLTAAGAFSLKQARTKNNYLLASFPLLFAIQQIIEGFSWLYLTGTLTGGAPACLGYGFLLYANVLWPILAPLSMYLIEKDPERQKALKGLLALGTAGGLYLFYLVVTGNPTYQNIGGHIQYNYDLKGLPEQSALVYLFVVTTPFILSTAKTIQWFGLLLVAAYFISAYAAQEAYVSVWCFFAALLSSLLCFHFWWQNRVAKKT